MLYEVWGILEDDEQRIDVMRFELISRRLTPKVFDDKQTLLEFAAQTPRALFSLDIDMGPDREREGLAALSGLAERRQRDGRDFLLAVVTGHDELRAEALKAGADLLIPKSGARVDTLELLTLSINRGMARDLTDASQITSEFLKLRFRQVLDLCQIGGNPSDEERAIREVHELVMRTLGSPFLEEPEARALSAIDTYLYQAGALPHRSIGDDLRKVSAIVRALDSTEDVSRRLPPLLRNLDSGTASTTLRWLPDDEEFS